MQAGKRPVLELTAAALFVAVNLAAPLVLGDMYPFTLAPMFRDEPAIYCEYEVYDPAGEQLDLEDFALQRVYDGNPRGMGVGIIPPVTIDRFGIAPSAAEIKTHVQQYYQNEPPLDYVVVIQRVIGPLGESVGVVEEHEIKVRLLENQP